MIFPSGDHDGFLSSDAPAAMNDSDARSKSWIAMSQFPACNVDPFLAVRLDDDPGVGRFYPSRVGEVYR